jgi:hypothetical protein
MKSALLLLVATLATAHAAEGTREPLPRLRLDPAGRATTQAAPKYDPTVGPSPALMMERVVVKGHSLLLRQPPQAPAPAQGPFSLLQGGAVAGRNLAGSRWEVGMTPYYDILWKDTRYKPPTTAVRYGLLNLSW